VHLGFGQAPRHRGAGRAGADDQDVNGIVFVHSWSLGHFFASFRGAQSANSESRDSQVRNCAPQFDAAHRPGMTA
jgi:hypothetical protein